MSLEIGEIIDQYRVEEVIGYGGMAVVYRVQHLQLESDHALKVLTITSSAVKRRLLQEGRAQAQLRHPNVVSVTYVVDVKGCPGLIMELVDGPALDAFLRKHILSIDQVDRLAAGILAGVAEAHAHALIHRDLKPANIMLARTSSGLVPKVSDFGLVKVLAEERSLSRTRSGLTMGTPRYMAPEQIRDAKHVDARADIFSMGAILYEMVTRHQAFPGDDTLELFKSIDEGRFIPPREHVPDLPERMDAAIRSALQVKRDDRPPSIRELQRIWQGRAPGLAASGGVSIAVTEATLGEDADAAPPHVEGELDTPTARIPAPPKAPAAAVAPTLPEEPGESDGTARASRPALYLIAVALLLMVGGVAWRLSGPAERTAGSGPPVALADTSPAVAAAAPPPEAAAPETATVAVGPDRTRSAVGAPPASQAPAPSKAPEPEAAPTAAPPAPAPASPQASPSPAPTSSAAPEAAPDPPSNTASVRFEGARTIWLESDEGRFEAGAVPAGRYRVTVFFDGVEPVTVGEITLTAGDQRVLRCSSSLRSCR